MPTLALLLSRTVTVFFGSGIGAHGITAGEICFNTAMTGYQEVLTDPSFAGQIITFTFPHIGNVGCNNEDIEANKPFCAGLIVRERPTPPSNFRSQDFAQRLAQKMEHPRHLRRRYARADPAYPQARRAEWGDCQVSGCRGIQGLVSEEALKATANHPYHGRPGFGQNRHHQKPYEWTEAPGNLPPDSELQLIRLHHVVAIDYGEKQNILRSLAERGCKVTVVPAQTSADEILQLKPDGIFLSNGPGDPAATGVYAVPVLKELIASGTPIFGICLGHQLLGLALGGKTEKLQQGHRGANQPVKNLETGAVEITSQNHGFAVEQRSLPANVEVTHVSLFDNTVEGLRCTDKPVFACNITPKHSPGPHDSQYLFRSDS